MADGPKLGHRLARPRDGDVLTLSHPVYDLAAMVPDSLRNPRLSHVPNCLTRETRGRCDAYDKATTEIDTPTAQR